MSIYKTNFFDPQSAAEKAVSVIGYGYDLTCDIRLTGCKPGPSGSTLIELGGTLSKDLVVPGGVVVPDVSPAIKCDKGDRTRFHSDVLSFNQMSEQFNQELSLSGKIPSGLFNSMFGYKGCWQKDAPMTKNLAFDGWFITLYNIELAKTQIALSEKVKQEVPSSWDPTALAEFIDKYGTHIVVGVKMGGKDVIYLKQLQSSNLEPTEVQNLLKQLADDEFSKHESEASVSGFDKSLKEKDERSVAWDLPPILANSLRPSVVSRSKKDDLLSIHVRRGGIDKGQSHKSWLSTVSQAPNVISMSFIPIVALLSGVRGSGFLSHAINLYLRYKPPIEELEQFLEFQLPRQWAPAYGDLPLAPRRKKTPSPSLQFTFLGPRLYVNTTKVDSENRPVTGVRLYLEGRKSDRLAIHLQHLSSIPKLLELTDDFTYKPSDEPIGKGYLEPVKWSIFSQVCTLPVEYTETRIDDSAFIVTKAWFEVKGLGLKKTLFLRLGYSMVASAKIRRSEWDGPSMHSRKSGLMSTLMSTPFSMGLTAPEPKPVKVELNSAIYPDGPPLRTPKMSSFVDTREMVRGPEDPPGYWVVSGAKLCVEGGRIRVKVKYSLLTIMSEDSMFM
ncbi:putative membrane attack complex component/perforin (MACPF) domain-containing protein [Helianthus annuus]|uniref:Membrane attack complex component/perforin (MACPF) domain-containing protein n=2 Tax=Helianthus annuus TaxID=4232 RepID=A0A251S8Z8_HELAN|nr:MACPF domain-containing protein NSL1 [Helianthus annuus]KAF5764952.1 putative membrane attack complex component/perforin (MACPF) domain-containing protein [Helianthus annuus]